MNYLPLAIMFALVGIAFGLFMVYKTDTVMKIQIKSYAQNNLRVEPISLETEIKNTKIRGINLIAICVLAIIYIKLFLI